MTSLALPDVRTTTRPQWHVTLQFLGDADVDAVGDALGDLRVASGVVRLGGAGAFPREAGHGLVARRARGSRRARAGCNGGRGQAGTAGSRARRTRVPPPSHAGSGEAGDRLHVCDRVARRSSGRCRVDPERARRVRESTAPRRRPLRAATCRPVHGVIVTRPRGASASRSRGTRNSRRSPRR